MFNEDTCIGYVMFFVFNDDVPMLCKNIVVMLGLFDYWENINCLCVLCFAYLKGCVLFWGKLYVCFVFYFTDSMLWSAKFIMLVWYIIS